MNAQIFQLIKAGALFVVNHSGGKDSQAMLIKVRELVPADQILKEIGKTMFAKRVKGQVVQVPLEQFTGVKVGAK